MFIELIDILRCTRPHEDTWLVAAFHKLVEREVVDGLLSCPVCHARYPIAEGVAYFDVPARTLPRSSGMSPGDADELAVRAAAFLNFAEGTALVLGGGWGKAAGKLAALGARVLVLDSAVPIEEGVSHVRTAGSFPFAAGSIHGAALDYGTPSALESAARALKPRGRLVAPAGSDVPAGVTEVARDAEWWIGERGPETVTAPVSLTRTRQAPDTTRR